MAADVKKQEEKKSSVIDLIEHAFHVARQLPVETFVPYFAGTMPFLLGLLYFWNDMGKNAYAKSHCITASLGLAVLFIWMKVWQSVFSLIVYKRISRVDRIPRSIVPVCRLVTAQTILHATSIVVLPAALLATLPFAWTYASYQLLLVQDGSEPVRLGNMVKESVRAARYHTLANHMVLLVFCVFGIFVALNIAAALYSLPFLAKMLFGIESIFTMGGFSLMNTTFLFSVIALTHLCVDPLVKIIFVLQTFYYRSRETGEDLMADLNRVQSISKTALVLVFIILTIPFPDPAQAGPGGEAAERRPPEVWSIDAQALEAAVRQTMDQREYAWRLPMAAPPEKDENHGFFYTGMEWVFSRFKAVCEAAESWMTAFWEWLEKWMPEDKSRPKPPESKSLINPHLLAAGLIGLVSVALLVLISRILRRKQATAAEPVKETDKKPDIHDEDILADRLPADQWADLAVELMEKGEFRAAVRALFLGTLAALADKKCIRIARHKSNREYKNEFSRKAGIYEPLVRDFELMVNTVDRVWYGMHRASRKMAEDVFTIQKRISHFAG